MLRLTKRLSKWQKFEMSVREFLRGIYLEDTIDPDDFGFTKYGDYQLDACGGLAGHFVLIDCTSANEPGSRSLKDKIKDFHNKQPDFRRDIERRFGSKYHSIHFAICTQDIDISDGDNRYATDRDIRIIPSESLLEWIKIKSIGSPTLAFQFIEYFVGQKLQIPGAGAFRFPAVKLPPAGGDESRVLYAFTATPEQLLSLCFIYRLEYKDVKGYQRPLKIGKLRDINRFLAEDPHNGFPNSLLVAFDEAPGREIRFEPNDGDEVVNGESRLGTLEIPPFYGIAEVIDGQHRLFGYFDFSRGGTYSAPLLNRRRADRLLVVAYPDPQQTERPRLFLDINSRQTRIPTRQIWAMMGRSRPDTEMGFIANLVNKLNDRGPLANKIQIPGVTRGTRPINIANLGKGIQDRNLLDNTNSFDWNLFEGVRDSDKYPHFPSDNIVRAFNDLFAAAKETASADWTSARSFLLSNNGVNVLLRLYAEALKFYRQENRSARVDRNKLKRLFTRSLSQYISDHTAPTLLRRTSTEAGREAVAAEVMAKIKSRYPGFALNYLRQRQRQSA
jgi:DGQHR domain-containing protein